MKHLLSSTLALAALVMLGACSSDDDIATATGGVTNNNENVPVAFQNYVGRDITTRGTIEDISTIGTKGFGVFAYDSEGDYTSGTGTYATFSDNFMSNQQVTASSSVAANSTAWTYSPLKYWPGTTTERISFLAYAPYSTDYATLYGLTGVDADDPTQGTEETTNPDRTYIKHTVNSDVQKQIDLMWNTTNALNQYLYPNAAGTGWIHSDNFNSTLSGNWSGGSASTGEVGSGTALRQNMKFSHATARIALAITSGALRSKLNFEQPAATSTSYSGDTPDETWTAGTPSTTTTTTLVKSDAQLTINDVKLLGAIPTDGGNGIAFGTATATGAFYPSGYLNLNNNSTNAGSNLTTDDSKNIYNPKWAGVATTNKLSFDFGMTNNETNKVFVDGTLGAKFYNATKDNDNTSNPNTLGNTVSGKKVWTPAKATETTEGRTLTEATSRDDATANNVVIGSGKITTATTTTQYTKDDGGGSTQTTTKTEISYSFTPDAANFVGTNLDQYLFVIPQDFTKTVDGSDELYAYLDYSLVYTDYKNDVKGYRLTHECGEKTDAQLDGTETAKPKQYYAYGKVIKNFVGGHSYVIVMNIGGASYTSDDSTPEVNPNDPKTFQPIQFTVEEVTGWGDEEDPDASL